MILGRSCLVLNVTALDPGSRLAGVVLGSGSLECQAAAQVANWEGAAMAQGNTTNKCWFGTTFHKRPPRAAGSPTRFSIVEAGIQTPIRWSGLAPAVVVGNTTRRGRCAQPCRVIVG